MLLPIAGGCLHRVEWFLYCGSFGPGGRDDRTGRSVRHPAMWPAVLPGGRPDEGGRRAATRWFDLDCKAGADPPRLSGNGVTRMTGVSEANEGMGNGMERRLAGAEAKSNMKAAGHRQVADKMRQRVDWEMMRRSALRRGRSAATDQEQRMIGQDTGAARTEAPEAKELCQISEPDL